MTCSAKYSLSGNASSKEVGNFYGDSLEVASHAVMPWDQIGESDAIARPWFIEDDGIVPEGGYTSVYSKNKSYWQKCSAAALMYETKNG